MEQENNLDQPIEEQQMPKRKGRPRKGSVKSASENKKEKKREKSRRKIEKELKVNDLEDLSSISESKPNISLVMDNDQESQQKESETDISSDSTTFNATLESLETEPEIISPSNEQTLSSAIPTDAQPIQDLTENEADEPISDTDFKMTSDFGFDWIDPKASSEDEAAFNALPQIEKKVRKLISVDYQEESNSWKAFTVYRWIVEYLPQLGAIEQRKFVFLNPSLRIWEPVFKQGTEKKAIIFNIYFLSNYNFVMVPKLWAGKTLKYTLFLYYIFLTLKLVVFNADEKLYYQYDKTKWQMRSPLDIIDDTVAFTGNLNVYAVEGQISAVNDRELLSRFRSAMTITQWPYVMAHNFRNGVLVLRDNRYTLLPHAPNLWQKHIILTDVGPSILPKPHERMLWLMLDIAGENLVSFNILKLIIFLVCEEGSHNLIINLCGNPKGAKSTLLNLMADLVGDGYRVGKISSTNSFQRENLLLNARAIVFPDSNPKYLTQDAIDLLKSMSGRDEVHVERKYSDAYSITTYAIIIISNNVNFEDVGPYKDAALADRVLNLLVPSISTEATVSDLASKLKDGLGWLAMFALTINPTIPDKTQRSREVNAVTGSGQEKRHLKFLLTHCLYLPGAKTQGSQLHDTYKTYMKGIDPKIKVESLQGFYQALDLNLKRLNPVGTFRKNSNKGVIYVNLTIAKASEKAEGQRFVFEGSSKMSGLMNSNPFRADSIVFKDAQGSLVEGPHLSPKINEELFDVVSNIKDKNLKVLFGEPFEGEESGFKHFEQTGFGGERTVEDLEFEEFMSEGSFDFQEELDYGLSSEQVLSESAEFIPSELLPYLDGVKKPMIASPDFHPSRINIEGVDKSYRQYCSYDLKTPAFITEQRDTRMERMRRLAAGEKKARIAPPLSTIQLSTPADRRQADAKLSSARKKHSAKSEKQRLKAITGSYPGPENRPEILPPLPPEEKEAKVAAEAEIDPEAWMQDF